MATNTLLCLTPDALVERLAASGLRGRGGGWFEAARKWRAVRVEGGEPFVIANGAEGEPGSYKDRFVMLTRPQDVVAGLALAARAVGAREAVVFLKGSFDRPAKALSGAIAAASLDGLSVEVRRGDDGYVAGEETAVVEALEGRKPWPRPKPPLPAAVGFRGRPTLVQNVETLARVPAALGDPEAYRRGETALVTVWGDVRRPGVHEVPLGTPLRRVIDEHAGGGTEPVGLVFPGGPAGMPLRASDLDVPLDPESLRAKGTALGTGAILVVGDSACPLAVAASVAGFFERENCGQCPPVRGRHREPRPHPARGRVGRLAPARPARPFRRGRLHVRPRLLRALPHRRRRRHRDGARLRGRGGSARRGRRVPVARAPAPGPLRPRLAGARRGRGGRRGAAAMRFPMRNDLIVLILATIASYPIGLAIGHPWVLPILNALPAYVVLVHRLRKGERGGTVRAMLWWATTVAIVGTVAFVWWPEPLGRIVLNGPAYKSEMFNWIRTGRGAEGNIRLFLPEHLVHLGAFLVVGIGTGSAGALVMGAVLMNFMSYYVAALAKAGVPAWGVTLLGWQPWAIARVAAFATLGVLLAEPLVSLVFPSAKERLKSSTRAAYIVAAMSGILADWFLKFLLAPTWGRWLRALLP